MSKYMKYIASMAAILTAGMIWADPVAKVGTFTTATEHDNIADALKALEGATGDENYYLTLLDNVELSEGLTFSDNRTDDNSLPAIPYTGNHNRMTWQIIDLNGYTITVNNGSKPALTYTGSNSNAALTIKNGKIVAAGTTPGALKVDDKGWATLLDLELSSETSDAPTCELTENSYNNVLKGSKITNAADNGVALKINSGHALVHSCEITADTETGTAVSIAQNSETGGVAIAHPNTKISGSTAVYVDPQSSQDVYLTGGTFTGTIDDEGELLWISGGKYSEDPTVYVGVGYTVEGEEGAYVVSDAKALLVDGVESSVADAFNFSGVTERTIKLNGEIFLLALEKKADMISVAKGQTITIDLNGHTLNVFDVSACFSGVNCGAVAGGGTLNIIDSTNTDSGYLSFAAWAMDYRSTPGYANNMVTITGNCNVESGTLENISIEKSRWSLATYNLDLRSSANVVISGGHILNSNTAIRLFYSTAQTLNMTGGEIVSGNTAIWVQGIGTTSASSRVDVTVSGGTMSGNSRYGVIYVWPESRGDITVEGDAEVYGGVYCYGTNPGNEGEKFIHLKGGVYGNVQLASGAMSSYKIIGAWPASSIEVSGGAYDPSYFYHHNANKFTEDENAYFTISGNYRMEEDCRYHFGPTVARLVGKVLLSPTGYAINSSNLPIDNYSSLPLALEFVSKPQMVVSGNYNLLGQDVYVESDGANSGSHTFSNKFSDIEAMKETRVYLQGHKVISDQTTPLVQVVDSGEAVVKIMDSGTITSKGEIFTTDKWSDSWVEIYNGDYSTKGNSLFSGEVYVMSDVGNGSYFDVNPASFSHDVSSFVYNESNAIEFKTLQATAVDNRWYLGRNVEVVKEQN